jgi:hypothetical protein
MIDSNDDLPGTAAGAGAASGIFPDWSPEEVAAAVAGAGLGAVAWDAERHARPSEAEGGRRCAEAAQERGLRVVCYDTRLRLGLRHQRPPEPEYWLEAAQRCGAGTIRVHTGGLPEWGGSATYRAWVAGELRRFTEAAEAAGLRVLLGVNRETLAPGVAGAVQLLAEAGAAGAGLSCSVAEAAGVPPGMPVLWRTEGLPGEGGASWAPLAARPGTLGILLDGVEGGAGVREAMARLARGWPAGP